LAESGADPIHEAATTTRVALLKTPSGALYVTEKASGNKTQSGPIIPQRTLNLISWLLPLTRGVWLADWPSEVRTGDAACYGSVKRSASKMPPSEI
jgi:hypothetical protein